ncbi:CinA family protein [Aeromicrobium sp. Leaf350]|uniref:CinA family protein n=1 Tax=Aeromicrobium sp. Leaf350 TaxID=2876565 RepID=UPI001E529EAA|nr:nicotinamide-nucleotide amidohydrolase family protein [Aeromicrobium sp. Leaf350]
MSGAPELVALLTARGLTVATAESLTGGAVCSELVSVPGASLVVRGGVVAYAADVKRAVLGVPQDLIDAVGTVDARVARAMAEGVRSRLGADVGLATTGNAGPDPSEGKPVGRVHVATAMADGTTDWVLDLVGDRAAIRRGTVDALLSQAVARLTTSADS